MCVRWCESEMLCECVTARVCVCARDTVTCTACLAGLHRQAPSRCTATILEGELGMLGAGQRDSLELTRGSHGAAGLRTGQRYRAGAASPFRAGRGGGSCTGLSGPL